MIWNKAHISCVTNVLQRSVNILKSLSIGTDTISGTTLLGTHPAPCSDIQGEDQGAAVSLPALLMQLKTEEM